MAQTLSKILYGRINLSITGGAGFSLNDLIDGVAVINLEEKRGSRILEDGSEKHWRTGWLGTIELTIDEFDTTDIANIIAGTTIAVTGVDSGQTFTMSSVDKIFVNVEAARTKITAIKSGSADKAASDIIAIT